MASAQWSAPANVNLGSLGSDPVFAASSTHLFVDGTYRSSDLGATWETIPYPIPPNNKPTTTYYSTTHSRYFSGHNSSGATLFYSDDNGTTWKNVATGPVGLHVRGFREYNNNLFAYTAGGVFKSTDGGVNWTLILTGVSGTMISMTELNGDLFVTATGAVGVIKSSDMGATWLPFNVGIESFNLNGDILWTMGGKLYFKGSGGNIFVSSNQALTWTLWPPIIPFLITDAVYSSNGRTYIRARLTPRYLYMTVDGGATFTNIMDNHPASIGENIIEHRGYLWTASGNQVYRRDTGSFPVDVEDTPALPSVASLNQNYPNPFNPSTNINFTVPSDAASSPVSLSVFDAVGRLVAQPVHGILAPGTHTTTFNASELPSGAYFYTLKVGHQTINRMMHLVK